MYESCNYRFYSTTGSTVHTYIHTYIHTVYSTGLLYMMCVHMIHDVLLQQYITVQYCTGSMSGHCIVIYYILCYTKWITGTCMNPVTTDYSTSTVHVYTYRTSYMMCVHMIYGV